MINSWVAEGEHWRLEGEDEPDVKFWGTTVELCLNWLDCLTFSDGDTYTWMKVPSSAFSSTQIVIAFCRSKLQPPHARLLSCTWHAGAYTHVQAAHSVMLRNLTSTLSATSTGPRTACARGPAA